MNAPKSTLEVNVSRNQLDILIRGLNAQIRHYKSLKELSFHQDKRLTTAISLRKYLERIKKETHNEGVALDSSKAIISRG